MQYAPCSPGLGRHLLIKQTNAINGHSALADSANQIFLRNAAGVVVSIGNEQQRLSLIRSAGLYLVQRKTDGVTHRAATAGSGSNESIENRRRLFAGPVALYSCGVVEADNQELIARVDGRIRGAQ